MLRLLRRGTNTDFTKFINAIFQSNMPEIIYYIEKKHIDVNANNCEALFTGVRYGNCDVVEYLIDKGADIYAMDSKAFRLAIEFERDDIIKLFIEQDVHLLQVQDNEALRTEAKRGRLSMVKYLIANGADVHALNDEALRNAAANGYVDVVKYLTDNGANVHALDDEALVTAAKNGHSETVQYLISRGARIAAQNYSAFFKAAYGGHKHVLQYLIETYKRNNGRKDILLWQDKLNKILTLALVRLAELSVSNPLENVYILKLKSVIKYLESRGAISTIGVRSISDLLEEGDDLPDAKTQYINDNVVAAEEENEKDELRQKKLFYNVKNVNRNTGKIIRAFDPDLLERMKQTRAEYLNPYTRNPWPLDDPIELKEVLKLVPKATQRNAKNASNTRTGASTSRPR